MVILKEKKILAKKKRKSTLVRVRVRSLSFNNYLAVVIKKINKIFSFSYFWQHDVGQDNYKLTITATPSMPHSSDSTSMVIEVEKPNFQHLHAVAAVPMRH